MARQVQSSEQASRRVWSTRRRQRRQRRHHDGSHDTVSEGVDGDHAGYDGIRPVTQVGRRRVEMGRGVPERSRRRRFEGRRGGQNTSILLRKRGRLAVSE